MEEIAKAFYQFYNSFEIPAFPENSVPVGTPLPYITYTISKDDFLTNTVQQVRVWYKTTSFKVINAKTDEILNRIDRGISLPLNNGHILIYKGSPEAQYQPSDDPSIKIAYINLQNNFLIK